MHNYLYISLIAFEMTFFVSTAEAGDFTDLELGMERPAIHRSFQLTEQKESLDNSSVRKRNARKRSAEWGVEGVDETQRRRPSFCGIQLTEDVLQVSALLATGIGITIFFLPLEEICFIQAFYGT